MRRNRVYTDIVLKDMHSSGRCSGFIGAKRIYLDHGIPGETVEATNVRHEGDYLRGMVSRVVEPSGDRAVPFCRHFPVCGGCSWQHISYEGQLKLKRRLLEQALVKYNIPAPVIPLPVPSPSTTCYRHRLDYTFSARRWYYEDEGKVSDPLLRLALGFHPADNPHKVIDIEECFLQQQPSRQICEAVRRFTLQSGYSYYDPKEGNGLMRSFTIRVNRKGKAMVILTFSKDEPDKIRPLTEFIREQLPVVQSLWWAVTDDPRQTWNDAELVHVPSTEQFLEEEANGLTFRISPRSFYQPNPAQAEAIFGEIRRLTALLKPGLVYDLYSGIGAIGLSVASDADRVIGIEGSADAVNDAGFNASVNGLGHCTFLTGDVLKTFTPDFVELHGRPGLVILDPPRSGTLIEIKKTILQAAPASIIYLSCNPLSLAYDLKMLTQGYRVSYIRPFDQFPLTHHLETLVMLERIGN